MLYLPDFDSRAVEDVKTNLERDPEGPPTEIVINSVDVPRNADVPNEVFAALEGLTSYVVPGPVYRSQVKRLHRLASLLVGDGLLPDAIRESNDFLVSVMEAERQRLETDGTLAPLITEAAIATVVVMDVELYNEDQETATSAVELATDVGDVDRMFATASLRFRDGLADTYWGYRVTVHTDDPYDAKILTVALGRDPDTVERVEHEAQSRVSQWLNTHGSAISVLSEDKKAKYADIRSMAREPEAVNPGLPSVVTMPNGDEIPAFSQHLFSDSKGLYRARLGEWEQHALMVELQLPGFVAWYRNPTGGQRALRIPFAKEKDEFGKMYPDFLVFHRPDDDTIRASIIDPHGHHLSDAAPKLRGLATYAEKHGAEYQRILAVIRAAGGEYRMLDLTEASARKAVQKINTQGEIESVFAKHGAVYS